MPTLSRRARRERRRSEAALADRERRRVRTTNGRPRSTRPVVIQVGGKKPKRRRRPKLRSKKHGVLAGLWLIISALFAICWLTLGGSLWLVGSLLMGLATVMAVIATFDPDSVVPAPPPRRAKPASPRGNGGSPARGSSSGTAPRKKVPVKPKRRTCKSSCRASTKPVTTCTCVCGGKTHGSAKLKVVS